MKRALLGFLLAGCLSSTTFAFTTISATMSVDDTHFYFDVVLDGIPTSATGAFRIATDQPFTGSNFERVQFNFDMATGAITIAEVVKTFGAPTEDRWLDGAITDLSLLNTGPGSWHITGSVAHGAQPFVDGDTVSYVTLRTADDGDVHLRDVVVGGQVVVPVVPGSVTVSAISGNTTEAGGSATFTTVLDSQPTAAVSIDLSSDDTSEGTVAPATLVFDDSNWDIPQVATVTGQDDDIVDGDITFNIITGSTVSSDPGYSGIVVIDVVVSNEDDDVAPPAPVVPAAPPTPIPTLSDLALLLMAALLMLAGLRQKRIQ